MRALEGQEEERCDLLYEIALPFERKAEAHPAPLLEWVVRNGKLPQLIELTDKLIAERKGGKSDG